MLAHLATLSEIAVFWVTHLLRPTEEEEEEEQEEKEINVETGLQIIQTWYDGKCKQIIVY